MGSSHRSPGAGSALTALCFQHPSARTRSSSPERHGGDPKGPGIPPAQRLWQEPAWSQGDEVLSCLAPAALSLASWRSCQIETQQGGFLPGSLASRKGSRLKKGAVSSGIAAHSRPGHRPPCFLQAQRPLGDGDMPG